MNSRGVGEGSHDGAPPGAGPTRVECHVVALHWMQRRPTPDEMLFIKIKEAMLKWEKA